MPKWLTFPFPENRPVRITRMCSLGAMGLAATAALRRRLPAFLVVLAAVSPLVFQIPAGAQILSAPALKADAVASVDRIRPGDTFRVAVILRLPAEVHVNAHVPSDSGLIPTQVRFEAPPELSVGAVAYPEGKEQRVAFLDKPISIYERDVVFVAPVTVSANARAGTLTLKGRIETQACNTRSCYPPTQVPFTLELPVAAPGAQIRSVNEQVFAAGRGTAEQEAVLSRPSRESAPTGAPASAATDRSGRARYPRLDHFASPEEFVAWLEQGSQAPASQSAGFADLLRRGNWLLALPLIFVGGLALNLTPCVYPLIPITIGFFGGQSGGSRRRMVLLALLYVLGMALMYSTLGLVAALTGGLFGSQLQSPFVLAGFAAVMVALGLSMFGLWEIRLPTGLTSRVSARAGAVGAFLMGLLVGVVAAPCIGPVVVALLQVVGSMGQPALGFGVFFVLALGLGVPYLVLGYFSGLIGKLPRSGEWMNGVKRVFGLVMFAMALYYLAPLIGPRLHRVVLPAYGILAGIYLAVIDRSGRGAWRFFMVKRGLGVLAALVSVWLLVPRAESRQGIPFEPYSEERLQQAMAEGRPVLIDFRADWCAECRRLESETFTSPLVVAATRGMVALKHDMTRQDDPEVVKVAQEFGIVGLPTVVLVPSSQRSGMPGR